MAETATAEGWAKYSKSKDAEIVRRCVASDEPFIVFRAQDLLATTLLHQYEGLAIEAECDEEFVDGIRARRREFAEWREDHPDKMKRPD